MTVVDIGKVSTVPNKVLDPWAKLVITGGLLLVLAVTLFPYHFAVDQEAGGFSLLSLVPSPKGPIRLIDVVNNVLLYAPLGLGLACLAQRRRMRRLSALALVLAVTAGLSFTVEVLQVFIPSRYSSLLDVLANATGGLLGFLCFHLWGREVLRYRSALEERIRPFLSIKILMASLFAYGALAFLLSIALQRATNLSNWDSSFPLLIGNERMGDRPWRGHIYRLEMANRAIPQEAVNMLSKKGLFASSGVSLIASYHFEGADRYPDLAGQLPELSWKGEAPNGGEAGGVFLTGSSWLETVNPAASLAQKIQETNQFTLRVVCAAANTAQTGPARIVSFSGDLNHRNFTLAQEGQDLVFRLRTPLTGKNGTDPQLVVPHIFATTGPRKLVITYDGAELLLFVDGLRHPDSLELGPGAALFGHFLRLDSYDLWGCKLVYYGLVFVPLGCLWAAIAGRQEGEYVSKTCTLGAGVLLPSVLLEIVLVSVSNRSINSENLLLGILATGAATLLMSAYCPSCLSRPSSELFRRPNSTAK